MPNKKDSNSLLCPTCNKRLSPPPRLCGGHDAPGDSTDKPEKNPTKGNSDGGTIRSTSTYAQVLANEFGRVISTEGKVQQTTDTVFNPEKIAALFANKSISIDNNESKGILVIKIDPSLTKDLKMEFAKFIRAVENELNSFVKANNISNKDYSFENIKDQSLTIKLPPQVYKDFIRQLNAKLGNFFLTPDAKQQTVSEVEPEAHPQYIRRM